MSVTSDVGYNGIFPTLGFVNNVINRYFTVYFPRAVNVSRQLRSEGYFERLVYTTHPWLVSLYLDCPPNLNLSGIVLQVSGPHTQFPNSPTPITLLVFIFIFHIYAVDECTKFIVLTFHHAMN